MPFSENDCLALAGVTHRIALKAKKAGKAELSQGYTRVARLYERKAADKTRRRNVISDYDYYLKTCKKKAHRRGNSDEPTQKK